MDRNKFNNNYYVLDRRQNFVVNYNVGLQDYFENNSRFMVKVVRISREIRRTRTIYIHATHQDIGVS